MNKNRWFSDQYGLVIYLWDKKFWIVLSVVLFTLLGIVKVLSAGDTELVRARISRAMQYQLGDLLVLNNVNEKKYESSRRDIGESLFDSLGSVMSSGTAKAPGEPAVSVVVRRDRENGLVSIEVRGSKGSQTLGHLKKYLDDANEMVVRNVLRNTLATLNQEKNHQIRKTDAEYQDQLEALEKALFTAKQAGIKDYQDFNPSSGEFDLHSEVQLFMLGEKYLNANINTLKKWRNARNLRFQQIQKDIEIVTRILDSVSFPPVYSFLEEPSVSDSPSSRKILVVLLSAFFGLIIGIGGVFLWSFIKGSPFVVRD